MPSEITVEPLTGLHAHLEASPIMVRQFLKMLPTHLAPLGVPQDTMENAQIVLGEVLNNVVEHAYCDTGEGGIDVRICEHRRCLTVEVIDSGVAMPGLKLPEKRQASINVSRDALPEGGFGWFFIHELVDELSYCRVKDQNLVRIGMHLA